MRRPWLFVVPILFVAMVAGLAFWLRSRTVGGGTCTPGQAADYFPYRLGTQASYAGAGNEFAAYTVDVVHQSGNLVEWRRASAGTTLAEVFQVTPNQVVLRYREGEAYDKNPRLNQPHNQSEPILRGPVQVGSTWSGGNSTYTIVAVNDSVVALGNQTLTCALLVEEQQAGAVTRRWYHQQYGLVLSIFDPGGSPVESRLASFVS